MTRLAHTLILAVLLAASAHAADFEARRHGSMPYRLLVPQNYDRARSYPLVVWLHGGGGRGSDNVKQISEGNAIGATIWARPENRKRHPAFVVAAQCPEDAMWTSIRPRVEPTSHLRRVVELIGELTRRYNIDRRRIYVAGQSMGGYAAWALLAEYPSLFAAAIPICGGGNVDDAVKITTPVWVFHGEHDRAVPVARSREMIAAMRRAGTKPRYTEYPNAGHVIWTRAFSDPRLLPWLFAQRRPSRPLPPVTAR